MFCFAHSNFFEDRHPLKPFRFHGISVIFYGKTVTVPTLFLIRSYVWGVHIVRAVTHES